MSEHYQFLVERAGEISLARIVEENPNASIILVRSADGEQGLLLVAKQFLAGYALDDNLSLGGFLLYEHWGYSRGGLVGRGNILRAYQDAINGSPPTGWRCLAIGPSQRRALQGELAAIASYKRGITVKIKVLG